MPQYSESEMCPYGIILSTRMPIQHKNTAIRPQNPVKKIYREYQLGVISSLLPQ